MTPVTRVSKLDGLLVALVLALTSFGFGGSSAHADHLGAAFYPRIWFDLTQNWQFHASVNPTTWGVTSIDAFKNAVRRGLNWQGDSGGMKYNWNALDGDPIEWTELGVNDQPLPIGIPLPHGDPVWCNHFGPGVNLITTQEYFVGSPGATTRCYGGNLNNGNEIDGITSIAIHFNQHFPWYAGTGGVPSNKLDLWSVAAHEWGHAMGQDAHFPENDSGCDAVTLEQNTMCEIAVDLTDEYGRARRRTIENPHDRFTYRDAYSLPCPLCEVG